MTLGDYDTDNDNIESPEIKRGLGNLIPRHRRRAFYAAGGIFLFIASIGTFYVASDAFDDRTQVLISARQIEAGSVIVEDDIGWTLALVDSVEHIAWTPEKAASLAGFEAGYTVPANTLLAPDIFVEPDTSGPPENSIELQLPLIRHPLSAELTAGATVLVVAQPVAPGITAGRPQHIVGDPVILEYWDGVVLRLYPAPADWEATLRLYSDADVAPSAIVVPPEHAEEIADALTASWNTDWEEAQTNVGFAKPRTGDLDMVLPLDTSLTPGPISNGDTILIIRPGSDDPTTLDAQPPEIIEYHAELEGWDLRSSTLRLFGLTPQEWIFYRSPGQQRPNATSTARLRRPGMESVTGLRQLPRRYAHRTPTPRPHRQPHRGMGAPALRPLRRHQQPPRRPRDPANRTKD